MTKKDRETTTQLWDCVTFDDQGLAPAIVQEAGSGAILMLAYVNQESLKLTLETGEMYYWSRSRQELWHKGGTSGHVQKVKNMSIDCDGDGLLFEVEQKGGACHTGYHSCFYRSMKPGDSELSFTGSKEFDPGQVYKS